MPTRGPRTHADNRSGNPWFDLSAHKLAQALYFADVITGKSRKQWYFRMTVTNNAERVGDAWVIEQQREYLREFAEEADLWFDTLEAFGGLRIDDSFRDAYMRRIEAALEDRYAGDSGPDEHHQPAVAAGIALGDNQRRSVVARVRHTCLRSAAAGPGR